MMAKYISAIIPVMLIAVYQSFGCRTFNKLADLLGYLMKRRITAYQRSSCGFVFSDDSMALDIIPFISAFMLPYFSDFNAGLGFRNLARYVVSGAVYYIRQAYRNYDCCALLSKPGFQDR